MGGCSMNYCPMHPSNIILCQASDIISTVGIDCSSIRLAGGTIEVWDFAGQLQYTATHQFFLSKEVSI